MNDLAKIIESVTGRKQVTFEEMTKNREAGNFHDMHDQTWKCDCRLCNRVRNGMSCVAVGM